MAGGRRIARARTPVQNDVSVAHRGRAAVAGRRLRRLRRAEKDAEEESGREWRGAGDAGPGQSAWHLELRAAVVAGRRERRQRGDLASVEWS